MGKDQDLLDAARNGDLPVVQKILNTRAKRTGPLASLRRRPGADVQDGSGFSALHHAALNGHEDVVALLLTHEASTNKVDHRGSSPLHLAAWSGNQGIVSLLLTKGPILPNVNLMNSSLETALHMASQYGHADVVKLLLSHGADPVITNARHETSLDLAAQYGRYETVQLLLNSHPELLAGYIRSSPGGNSRTNNLYPHTPLHLASRNGHRKVVELLVKAGFDVNVRTSQGTALHEAALCGKVDVVKALLDANIDVCVADSQRRTAVDRLNEVGLKTPVAQEIAELIRRALKRTHIQSGKGGCSPVSSPQDPSGSVVTRVRVREDKCDFNCIIDDHLSHSDVEGKGPSHSAITSSHKAHSIGRPKVRRSSDIFLVKGTCDFDRPAAPPKKPPRRNLSASPTHPGLPDLVGGNYDCLTLAQLGRNKSMDEGAYSDRWKKTATYYESHSTDSIDLSPCGMEGGKSDIAFFNGLPADDLTKGQRMVYSGGESSFVSVAHIKLRDAKSEQNVCPSPLMNNKDRKDSFASPVDSKQSKTVNNKQNEKVRIYPKGPKPAIAPKPVIAPKPKNIRRQVQSCDNHDDKKNVVRHGTTKSTSMTTLSPVEVDVDKEWGKLASFMNSLGVPLGTNGTHSNVGSWLSSLKLAEYESLLKENGFDDIDYLGEEIVDDNSLMEIGILNAQHRKVLVDAALKLPVKWPTCCDNKESSFTIDDWLIQLKLQQYAPSFRKNLYTDPDRVLRLWNDELTTLLDIDSVGHRRRLLAASVKARAVKIPENGFDTTVEDTSFDGSLSLRNPNDLVSGVSSVMKTAWRHTPETLIDGSVTYKAIYVGSSPVKEFSTTESIQGAIQQIRSQELANGRGRRHLSDPQGGLRGPHSRASLVNLEVTLIVSATVVSWYNAITKNLVREQDIGSIQCTCQASDDLRHLALVTRSPEQSEKTHSCHVFCLDSVEIATEAIMTLGQAFEVAFQLALVSRRNSKDLKGHTRSKSANQLSTKGTTTGSSNAKGRDMNDTRRSCVPPTTCKSLCASPQVNQIRKEFRLPPRAESFSFTSSSAFSRAPIVSKEEL